MKRTTRLINALAYSSQPTASRLQQRLGQCGGEGWNGAFTCRTPGCRRCRDRYVGQQRRAAEHRFAKLGNSNLASFNIIIGATSDLREIGAIWTKFRKDVRNLRDSLRRISPRWNGLQLLVWLEVDAFDGADFVHLGPDKKRQYDELPPFTVCSTQPVWVVTAHGILAHTGIDLGRAKDQFERRWPGFHRVHMEPFDHTNSVTGNISGVVNYALKHRCEVKLGRYKEPWPMVWMADFYAYLHGWSRGFHSTRISLNEPSTKDIHAEYSEKKLKTSYTDNIDNTYPLPLLYDYSSFPTPFNWTR